MATSRVVSIEDGNLGKSTIKTTISREYVDIDLSFAKKAVSGELFLKRNAAAVKQAVQTLLLTGNNEKPFQPFYGANLNDFLFELLDKGEEQRIKEEIREAIRVYEPRVNSKNLTVKVDIDPDANSMEVTTIFQIINSKEIVEVTTRLSRLR